MAQPFFSKVLYVYDTRLDPSILMPIVFSLKIFPLILESLISFKSNPYEAVPQFPEKYCGTFQCF